MKIILLALVTCFVLTLPALGQKFSESWTSVPNLFAGDDIRSVMRTLKLSPNVQPKDEFETIKEFIDRTRNLKAVNFGNGKTGESLLVFRYEPSKRQFPRSYDPNASYNAETQMLTMTLPTQNIAAFLSAPRDLFLAAPAVRLVNDRDISTTNYIAISNIDAFGNKSFTGDVKLPPAAARDAKNNLSFLIMGRIVIPFFDNSVVPGYNVIYLEVSEVWFFNDLTGEIYLKLKPSAVPAPVLQ